MSSMVKCLKPWSTMVKHDQPHDCPWSAMWSTIIEHGQANEPWLTSHNHGKVWSTIIIHGRPHSTMTSLKKPWPTMVIVIQPWSTSFNHGQRHSTVVNHSQP